MSGQSGDLGLVRENLSVAAPVWKNGADSLSVNFGVRESHFFTDAVLPDTGRPFPKDLWSVNTGLTYTHRFDNGWTGTLMGGFGSSSDKPFNGLDVMNGSVTALLRVPARNDRDAWTFGVAYTPAGNLNFPVPLVAYAWNYSEKFQMNIGLPFSLTWHPSEDWTVTAFYVPLFNVIARVTYRATARVYLYSGYENTSESYYLADREDKQDRFFALEQRLLTGVRWDVWRHVTLDLNGGYAFGRQYGEGLNQGASLHDRVHVDPGAFLGLSMRARF